MFSDDILKIGNLINKLFISPETVKFLEIQTLFSVKPELQESISQMVESYDKLLKVFGENISSQLQSSLQMQLDIFKQVKLLDYSSLTFPISPKSSEDFKAIAEEIVTELKESEYAKPIIEENPSIVEIPKGSKLTFDRLLAIIAIIISIISYVQQQLPDQKEKYLKNIDEKLQILVDIQTSEASNLLKDANDFIQYPEDIMNPKSLDDDSSGQ